MELQKILSKNVVSNETVTTANAENLHAFLEAKSKFSDWIRNRITKYGFIENVDYIKTARKVGNATAYDYHITLDMAKELCMVENNEKGREARRYFIECEKHLQIGQEQFDRLKETVIQQNAQIAQLTRELGEGMRIDPMEYNFIFELIGQVSRSIHENEVMEKIIRKRRTSMENFLRGLVGSTDNRGILEQSKRKSENISFQTMVEQK